MHYSLYHQRPERKIPGYVVLGVLALFVGGLVMVFKHDSQPVLTKQDPSVIERVDMTNIRDASVTVFWRTKKPTESYLTYNDQKVYDERDTESHLNKRFNHIATLSYPKSDSDVPFYIVIDGKSFGQSEEVPFVAHTGRPLTNSLDIAPLYGTIGRQNGSNEKEAIVIATIGSAKPLLTQTNDDGTFLFSPCCLYSAQSGEPLYPSATSPVRLEIIAEDGTSKILLTDLAKMSPLQDKIVVDGEEDEVEIADVGVDEGVVGGEKATKSSPPEVLAASDSIIRLQPVDIIFPRVEAAIPGSRPLIRGVGEPGESVKGRFTPADRLFQVNIDENRNWIYQPTFDFEPGEQKLTVDTRNALGQPVSLTRTFTILKAGEAVLGDATGSATLTPTEIPTPEITATSSPTIVTSAPTPPVTGFSVLPFTLLSLVLIVIGAGFILLF